MAARRLTQKEEKRLRDIVRRTADLRKIHGEDIQAGAFVRVAIKDVVEEREFLQKLIYGEPTEVVEEAPSVDIEEGAEV